MDTNIISEYTDFIKKELLRFFSIVLKKDYNKKLTTELVDRYILVRYYNETRYRESKDFLERIGKELKDVINPYLNNEEDDSVKTLYALFAYIFYFDDCYYTYEFNDLLDIFFKDDKLKITFDDEQIKDIKNYIKSFEKNKIKFHKIFETNQFSLNEHRIKKNLYALKLSQNIKISNLYSEYAIEKSFNMGVVNEDKLFVLLLMSSEILLSSAKRLDFSRYYVIDLPVSLFSKEKKVERVFNYIDNFLTKKHFIINIYYEDYLKYTSKVDDLIREGYSFSITISNDFDENYSKFILFRYVFLYEDSEFYDMIMENKEVMPSELIVL